MCRKQCPPRHATEREYRIAERRSPLFLHEFAVQRGRRGGKYLNFGKLTYMCVFTIENNHLVLLRASEQLFATALARALYQYVENFSYTFLVVFQRKSVLQSNEFVKATNLDILGNVIIEMFCCISAGAFAVFEHERGIVSTFFHKAQRQSMIFFRLRAIAAENVG